MLRTFFYVLDHIFHIVFKVLTLPYKFFRSNNTRMLHSLSVQLDLFYPHTCVMLYIIRHSVYRNNVYSIIIYIRNIHVDGSQLIILVKRAFRPFRDRAELMVSLRSQDVRF